MLPLKVTKITRLQLIIPWQLHFFAGSKIRFNKVGQTFLIEHARLKLANVVIIVWQRDTDVFFQVNDCS